MREGYEKRPFSHCRYCIPIHQAALLSRAEPGVSRPFLFYNEVYYLVCLIVLLYIFQCKLSEVSDKRIQRINHTESDKRCKDHFPKYF